MALFYALQDFDYYLVFRDISHASQMDEALLVQWIDALGPRHTSRTKNRRLRAIRGLFRCLRQQGVIQSDPARSIPYLREKHF